MTFPIMGIAFCLSRKIVLLFIILTDHHVMVTDFPQQQDIILDLSLYEMPSNLENKTFNSPS